MIFKNIYAAGHYVVAIVETGEDLPDDEEVTVVLPESTETYELRSHRDGDIVGWTTSDKNGNQCAIKFGNDPTKSIWVIRWEHEDFKVDVVTYCQAFIEAGPFPDWHSAMATVRMLEAA